MKKTNLIKIFAPVVAIALLIGALVGIGASAAETPEIVSMNVEYGSELYLYYAVDKASVEGTPALEVVTSDGALIKTVYAYDEATVNGTACYIFKTAGIAPGQLNKAEYVRASGSNGKSDIVSYSVEEYFYERLFMQGFAAKTPADGTDYYRRNLYFSYLEYGNSAQELFYADDADKIGDSIYVAVKGNSALSGEYAYTDVIKLAAPAIEGFDYWLVTELSSFGDVVCERKLSAGFEYTVTNSAVIVPVADDDAAEDVEAYDPTVISFTTESDKIKFIKGKNETANLNGRVYDAETDNWYYDLEKIANDSGVVTFTFTPTAGDPTTATKMVAKFDIYAYEGAKYTDLLQSNLITNAAKDKSSTYLYAPFLHAHSDYVKAGMWNHFEIIYEPTDFIENKDDPNDTEAFTATIYINGRFVKTLTDNYSKGRSDGAKHDIPKLTEIYGYTFSFNTKSNGHYKIDNVSLIFE